MIIVLTIITLLVIVFFVGYSFIRTIPEPAKTTYLPQISIKESEYIKQKRIECIERYKDKLLLSNPERKVDLCNPTILVK